MADDLTPPEALEELQPVDPDVVTPEEALAASEAGVLAEDEATVIIEEAPPPLGQAIAMDFESHSIIADGHGPKLVRRQLALRQWIEKCLRTHRGAHPIHPEGYGMNEAINDLLGQSAGVVSLGEVEEEIREALLFHPSISDVTNFQVAIANPDEVTGDATGELSFLVVQNDGSVLPLTTSVSGVELT
jgi:Protein of unknown function (DUF2634)